MLATVAVASAVTFGWAGWEMLRQESAVEEQRERERLENRADRVGDWALVGAIAQCILMLAVLPAALLQWWLAPMILAHALIGFLIVRTLVEHAALVAGYAWARR